MDDMPKVIHAWVPDVPLLAPFGHWNTVKQEGLEEYIQAPMVRELVELILKDEEVSFETFLVLDKKAKELQELMK